MVGGAGALTEAWGGHREGSDRFCLAGSAKASEHGCWNQKGAGIFQTYEEMGQKGTAGPRTSNNQVMA